jgi:hypothetical protein
MTPPAGMGIHEVIYSSEYRNSMGNRCTKIEDGTFHLLKGLMKAMEAFI